MNANRYPSNTEIDLIWNYVNRYITPITIIENDDTRDPPGNHRGTGWFVEKNERVYLCTCEHVVNLPQTTKVGFAPLGAKFGIGKNYAFKKYKHPIDFSFVDITDEWCRQNHSGKAINIEMFHLKHCHKEDILYLQGFPGEDAVAYFGEHRVKCLGATVSEIYPPEEIHSESPEFMSTFHACVGWSPAHAVYIGDGNITLPKPPGLSGSILWNTRYREFAELGKVWSVQDMRISGIVWGASSKASCLTITRVEEFLNFLINKQVVK